MILKIDSLGDSEEREIDLGELIEEFSLTDVEAIYSLILMEVSRHTMKAGCKPEDAWLNSFEHEGHELLSAPHSWEVWEEVAQLAHWLLFGNYQGKEHGEWEYLPVFACIETQQWKWFSFDSVSDEMDNYSQEFDGDHQTFAINWMNETGEGIPEHLEPYFDFEEYGRALISDYVEVEYEGTTYLFHQ